MTEVSGTFCSIGSATDIDLVEGERPAQSEVATFHILKKVVENLCHLAPCVYVFCSHDHFIIQSMSTLELPSRCQLPTQLPEWTTLSRYRRTQLTVRLQQETATCNYFRQVTDMFEGRDRNDSIVASIRLRMFDVVVDGSHSTQGRRVVE